MAERYCAPICRICKSPGPRMCAASARAEADERYFEEVDYAADEARARRTGPFRPPGTYFDVSDPWPATASGVLRDDPALERG